MKVGLNLLGRGGGGGGGESVVSKVEEPEAELELGLGLSLGGGGGVGGKGKGCGRSECGRILTAKDFPCLASNESHKVNSNSKSKNGAAVSGSVVVVGAVSGTKRAADSVSHESGGSPTAAVSGQVVGWPPIRAYRINSLVNQAKSSRAEEEKTGYEQEKSKDASKKEIYDCNKTQAYGSEKGRLGFVKVNMDGAPIGRKVDLHAHPSYETLAQTLEDMFFGSTTTINSAGSTAKNQQAIKPSKLLDASSEFALTYEDKEGDWMLVGDVPWRMFLSSVRRLRIMRTSEANGLAPRFEERTRTQRSISKPV